MSRKIHITYEKRDPRSLTGVNVVGNGIIGYLRTCERKIATRRFKRRDLLQRNEYNRIAGVFDLDRNRRFGL